MHLTLVQHMETDWNAQGLFTSQAFHIRLNPTGIAQAEQMATFLESEPFEMIVSSDQVRALETAVIIATRHPNLQGIETDRRLREARVGYLVGTKITDVTEPLFRTRHPQFDFRPVGGEHRAGVIARVREAFDDVKGTGVQEVLAVGHGTAFRILLEDLGVTEIMSRSHAVRIEY